jgi:acyl-CoA thioesterase II
VGDLGDDTALEALGDGRYLGRLSREWEIWGPMGGYAASFALRAAGEEASFARPASFFCHYLSVGRFDEPLELAVTALRRGRAAESLRVEATQGDRRVLEATVLAVADVDGLEHHEIHAPDVPAPLSLPLLEELRPDDAPPSFPFWDNVEERIIEWHEEWPPTEPYPPVWRVWVRLRPTPSFADPWLDACRAVIFVDVQGWPSAQIHHAWTDPPYVAPNLDLYVAFHEPLPADGWLLVDGHAPVAGAGLIGWTGRLWSTDRRLVASGGGQLLCRRTG